MCPGLVLLLLLLLDTFLLSCYLIYIYTMAIQRNRKSRTFGTFARYGSLCVPVVD